MRTYTVSEISSLLDASPETVRRWIRGGELTAIQTSRKEGNQITEDDLLKFLRSKPRYRAIVGRIMTERLLNKSRNTPLRTLKTENDLLENLLAEHIVFCQEMLEQKKNEIAKLQEEIGKLQALILTLHDPKGETT